MRQLDIGEIEEIKEVLIERNPEVIFFDDIEEALIGVGERFGAPPVALYSKQHAFQIYMEYMSYEEAEEHFGYNVIGGWVGDSTPMFADFEVF